LINTYKLKAAGSNTDNDLQSLFSLDIGDPYADKITGALQIGGYFDLDGKKSDSRLTGIYDTFTSDAVGRVYYGYFDIKDAGPIYKFRGGRQYNHEFESLHFDGASFETSPEYILVLKAYGGIPVHMYENQWGKNWGDWLVGGALEYNPVSKFKARADYVQIKDKFSAFSPGAGNQDDGLLGASLWYDPTQFLSLYGKFTSFTSQVRDASFEMMLKWVEKNFQIKYRFYSLIKAYSFKVTDLDGFSFAGDYEPYYEMMISLSKGFGNNFAVDTGYSKRSLVDFQSSSAFNHGYDRVFFTLSSFDIPLKLSSLSLTLDYYRGRDNSLKNNYYGTSFFISQGFIDKRIEASIGTAYYLYRYNLFAGDESSDVQTYYARVEARIFKPLKAKISYEFEDNDFANFHTFSTGFSWQF
jgi:hypothetical protein